jgi:hypothetical protein
MTDLLQEAIDVLKDLPSDAQDLFARAILEYASADDDGDVALPVVG